MCSGNSVESTRARYDAGVVHGTTRQCYAARLVWCTCFFWKTVPISFPFASCSCRSPPCRWSRPPMEVAAAGRYSLPSLPSVGPLRRGEGEPGRLARPAARWDRGRASGPAGQDVEGRPTPAVPSPSVSSGNTWICRVTRSRQEEGGELGDGIGELVVDGPWTCGAQARRRPRGARAERVLPTAWRANGAWLTTDWNDGAMTMRPPWALKGQGCADRGEQQ